MLVVLAKVCIRRPQESHCAPSQHLSAPQYSRITLRHHQLCSRMCMRYDQAGTLHNPT